MVRGRRGDAQHVRAEERQALELRQAGNSYARIGEIMGAPMNTVASYVYQARQKLRLEPERARFCAKCNAKLDGPTQNMHRCA